MAALLMLTNRAAYVSVFACDLCICFGLVLSLQGSLQRKWVRTVVGGQQRLTLLMLCAAAVAARFVSSFRQQWTAGLSVALRTNLAAAVKQAVKPEKCHADSLGRFAVRCHGRPHPLLHCLALSLLCCQCAWFLCDWLL
jgi:hypothetical protein